MPLTRPANITFYTNASCLWCGFDTTSRGGSEADRNWPPSRLCNICTDSEAGKSALKPPWEGCVKPLTVKDSPLSLTLWSWCCHRFFHFTIWTIMRLYHELTFSLLSVVFQENPWWQEKQVYGIITALRNSFSIHGEIMLLCSGHNQLNIQNCPNASLHQSLFLYSTVIASNILLVDEIMRAGMSSLKG